MGLRSWPWDGWDWDHWDWDHSAQSHLSLGRARVNCEVCNAIPTGSMRFSSGAYGATVTFDRFYTVGGHVWTGTDVAGAMYTPSTGEVNPFIWEATDPSCGINQTSSNLIVADNANQNAALEIRGGTYKTTGNFNVATAGSAWLNIKNATIQVNGVANFGSGGTAEVNFEEGSITTGGDLVMAKAAGTKARLTVGSGDPARVAKFTVPINKWVQMCGDAAGDGAMTIKAGGEFHCGYLCSRNPNAVLTLDDGGDHARSRRTRAHDVWHARLRGWRPGAP